jgi:hypothetical protein
MLHRNMLQNQYIHYISVHFPCPGAGCRWASLAGLVVILRL